MSKITNLIHLIFKAYYKKKFSLLPPMLLMESIVPLVNQITCQMIRKDGSLMPLWCLSLNPQKHKLCTHITTPKTLVCKAK